MPTNPEGLPSLKQLPGGYALKKPAIPMCEASRNCWAIVGGKYAGNIGYIHNNEVEAFAAAMHAPTDALGIALGKDSAVSRRSTQMRKGFYLLITGTDEVEKLAATLQQAGVRGIMVITPEKAMNLHESIMIHGYEILIPHGWLTYEQKHILDARVKSSWLSQRKGA